MGRRRKGPKPPPKVIQHIYENVNGEACVTVPPGVPTAHAMRRLSLKPYGTCAMDAELIAKRIDSRPGLYFCDPTMFLAETEKCIWDSLLQPNRLVLVPPIIEELSNWLRDPKANHCVHPAMVAASKGDETANITALNWEREVEILACEYYVNLLGQRKNLYSFVRQLLKHETGKEPTNQEISNYCQKLGTSRAQLLGRQGHNPKVEGHRYHDECLVVMAAMYAIITGQEVTIFSGDPAVLDQFYKFMWLLDTHYRSMLLADRYAADPLLFKSHRPDNNSKAFLGDKLHLLEVNDKLLTDVLPEECRPVLIKCVLIERGHVRSEDRISHLVFCAEVEMRRLFVVKAATKGLNTNRFEGKNCHAFLGRDFVDKYGNWAAIVHDNGHTVPRNGLRISLVDIDLVMLSHEQGRRVTLRDSSGLILPDTID
jgi:hypothetical protein